MSHVFWHRDQSFREILHHLWDVSYKHIFYTILGMLLGGWIGAVFTFIARLCNVNEAFMYEACGGFTALIVLTIGILGNLLSITED